MRRTPGLWHLDAALGEEDPEVFLLALRDVAHTREGGLAALAETAQRNRGLLGLPRRVVHGEQGSEG